MKRNRLLLLMVALVSCRGCGVCGKGVDTDAEELGWKRIGPCTYEYSRPFAWWRAGFVAVEIHGLATPRSYVKVDEINRRVTVPCTPNGDYSGADGGEPDDMVIVYVYQ